MSIYQNDEISGGDRPVSQLLHSWFSKLYSPALQSSQNDRSGLDSLPAAQSSQDADPTLVLNFPGGQSVQSVGQGAVSLLFNENLPMPHSRHTRPS
jgi:hypothetical protein